MKIELTNTGWKEITTKYIKIESIHKNCFSEVGHIVLCNEKFLWKKQSRYHCNLCHKKWEDMSILSAAHLVFTNVGNKLVCDSCCVKLREKINVK